jgi:hypothetical protein
MGTILSHHVSILHKGLISSELVASEKVGILLECLGSEAGIVLK